MIKYDYGVFGCRLVLQVKGSVFPKALVWAVPNTILTFLIWWFATQKDINLPRPHGVETLWQGFTFVVGFLLVFRNSHAYARLWEGATLLHQTRGEWINCISSCFAFCSTDVELREQVRDFQHLIVRLMSMLHCQALQVICDLEDDSLEIIDISGLDPDSIFFLSTQRDRCEIVTQWIQRAIIQAVENKTIIAAPPILSRAFQELSRGMVNLNNVRKIKDVPFPFPYTQMIQLVLMIHSIMTPLMANHFLGTLEPGPESGHPFWAMVMTFLVTGANWSLVYIAQEIDDPFGDDSNDFDLREMQMTLNNSLLTLMHPRAQTPPEFKLQDLDLVQSHHMIMGRRDAENQGTLREVRDRLRSDSFLEYFDTKNQAKPRRNSMTGWNLGLKGHRMSVASRVSISSSSVGHQGSMKGRGSTREGRGSTHSMASIGTLGTQMHPNRPVMTFADVLDYAEEKGTGPLSLYPERPGSEGGFSRTATPMQENMMVETGSHASAEARVPPSRGVPRINLKKGASGGCLKAEGETTGAKTNGASSDSQTPNGRQESPNSYTRQASPTGSALRQPSGSSGRPGSKEPSSTSSPGAAPSCPPQAEPSGGEEPGGSPRQQRRAHIVIEDPTNQMPLTTPAKRIEKEEAAMACRRQGVRMVPATPNVRQL